MKRLPTRLHLQPEGSRPYGSASVVQNVGLPSGLPEPILKAPIFAFNAMTSISLGGINESMPERFSEFFGSI